MIQFHATNDEMGEIVEKSPQSLILFSQVSPNYEYQQAKQQTYYTCC